MKRTLALILALVMVFALAIPAMAANEANGTITIKDPLEGHTYSVYRIFDLSYGASTGAHSYTVNSAWKDFAAISTYFDVDAQGYITSELDDNDPALAEFAQLALAYAKENEIAPTDSGKTAFTGLPLGYYLIDSSAGALCSLDSTNTSAEVREKNAAPTILKEVKEDLNGFWGSKNTAEPGERVDFRITINVQDGAENYVLYDEMEYYDSVQFKSIKYDGTELVKGADKDYTIEMLDTATMGEDEEYKDSDEYIYVLENDVHYAAFELTFTKAMCDKFATGKSIVIEYSAVLNEKQINPQTGRNTAYLGYGDGAETEHSRVLTYNYNLYLLKIAAIEELEGVSIENCDDWDKLEELDLEFGEDIKLLDGAEFKLYREDGSVVKFNVDENNEDIEEFPVYYVWAEAYGEAETDTIKGMGAFICGLDAGTYYLEEVKAPDGYNKLANRVQITVNLNGDGFGGPHGYYGAKRYEISGDSKAIYAGINDLGGIAYIQNTTGVELPTTGGIGTTIFYIVGGLLVVGAAVVLVSKKRMSAE